MLILLIISLHRIFKCKVAPASPSPAFTMDSYQTPTKDAIARANPHLKAHVFASNKGGTGKTSTLFHAAAQYAKDHPDEQVLVIDCSYAGDVSKRYLGGARTIDGKTAKAIIKDLEGDGKSSNHLMQYIMELSKQVRNDDAGATPPSTGPIDILGDFRRLLSVSKETGAPPTPSALRTADIVKKFGILVKDYNQFVTLDNLFLIPSGASGGQPCVGLDMLSSRTTAKVLRTLMEGLPGTWRVFFDSDGEIEWSKSLRIIARASESFVNFSRIDADDFDRVTDFIRDVADTKKTSRSELCADVGVICLTNVAADPQTMPPATWDVLGGSVKPHLLAARELAERYTGIIGDQAIVSSEWAEIGLFSNMPRAVSGELGASGSGTLPPGRAATLRAEFLKRTFLVIQDFKKPGIAAVDVGVPFCCMNTSTTYKGGYGEYKLEGPFLERLIINIRELIDRL